DDVESLAEAEARLRAAQPGERVHGVHGPRARRGWNLRGVAAKGFELEIHVLGDIDDPVRDEGGLDVRRVPVGLGQRFIGRHDLYGASRPDRPRRYHHALEYGPVIDVTVHEGEEHDVRLDLPEHFHHFSVHHVYGLLGDRGGGYLQETTSLHAQDGERLSRLLHGRFVVLALVERRQVS